MKYKRAPGEDSSHDNCCHCPHRDFRDLVADSKVSTQALAGVDASGQPILLPQTYHNVTKICQDASKCAIAMAAGNVGIGPISITDYIASSAFPKGMTLAEQEAKTAEFVKGIADLRTTYWQGSKLPEAQWPPAAVLLSIASPAAPEPLVWRVTLAGSTPDVRRILGKPGVYMEGSYAHAFSLLYGYSGETMRALGNDLEMNGAPVGVAAIKKALAKLSILKPLNKLSLDWMPDQDAVDLGCFLATVQIQMERFLPGSPVCGGPLDVTI